jgi:transcriptional regulator GlxA family with amidase domain
MTLDLTGVEAFDDLWNRSERQITPVRNPARLIGAFQRLAARYAAPETNSPLLRKAALLELLAIAQEEFSFEHGGEMRPYAIEKALEWMANHFDNPDISRAMIAEAGGLSVHHFGRLFRETMGMGAMNYLRELRIRQSCALLTGTALRIGEAARAVGFRDPLHFSRVFHKAHGMSPRAYRQR